MSTRGLRIIRFRGRYFIYYNHSDSYPTGLGIDIVSNVPTDPERYQGMSAYYFFKLVNSFANFLTHNMA
jgi:hypothetical protein